MSKAKKKTGRRIMIGILCAVIVAVAIVGFSMYREFNATGGGEGETVTVVVDQGEGLLDISAKLKEAGLIKYRIVFALKAMDMRATMLLRYGTFELHKDASAEVLVQELTTGGARKEDKMFTIPEGYTIEQIAVKLEEEEYCYAEDFLQAVELDYDHWFLQSIPEDADVRYRLQGFLYPETYAISEDMSAEDIVRVMLDHFGDNFSHKMEAQAKAAGKTVYDIVTAASMIEKETALDAERELIAGVIENRLEIDMRLQIDPTFLYPLTEGLYDIQEATYEHTEYDSPYNTYMYKGLPVGPISNPGLASIMAALNPAEHNYYYYHTDTEKNDGSHIFTETYEDHLNTQD